MNLYRLWSIRSVFLINKSVIDEMWAYSFSLRLGTFIFITLILSSQAIDERKAFIKFIFHFSNKKKKTELISDIYEK